MNSKEELSPTQSHEQEPAKKEQREVIPLSTESREALEELSRELKNLQGRLDSPEIKKIAFGASGGEQEIGKQMVTLQKENLPKIFGNTEFETPYLPTHDIQTEQYSCQLATTANVLRALGIPSTEREIAEAIGKSGKTASIWPEELSVYLRSKGLEVSKISSVLEAINSLISGGKIILPLVPPKYPISHAVAISGIKIKNGKIEFYINDPQYKNYAEAVSLDDIADTIIPYSFHKMTPAYAISRKDIEQGAPNE